MSELTPVTKEEMYLDVVLIMQYSFIEKRR